MQDYIIDLVRRYVDDRVRRSGDANVACRCPFHKGGQETRPSFTVNVEIGVFNCYACHESGTIPTLLTLLGVPAQTVDRETKGIRDQIKQNLEDLRRRRAQQFFNNNPFRAHTALSETFIAAYNMCPMPLVNFGFQWEWLQYLQIGVDRYNNRITYPVRDIYGNLAGFVGGATLAGQQPKYKVYQDDRKELNGTVTPGDYGKWFKEEYPDYEFKKSQYLWNYDRVYPRLFFTKEVDTLIIVEGFKACIWLLQHGYRNTVALMGSNLSERQKQLLLRVNANILLFLDNDSAGQDGTLKIGRTLQKAVPTVRVVRYPGESEDCQPDDLEYSTLRNAIGNAVPFRQWKKERTFKWV